MAIKGHKFPPNLILIIFKQLALQRLAAIHSNKTPILNFSTSLIMTTIESLLQRNKSACSFFVI
ncbi:hypothetical protein AA0111_g12880 [Alternaria arborescens]|uniref:hypothetical protein n=1 Tax=Alternaria arborescens TaxID=156630 RepID=UPI0010753857|nr:hypothetical protein AA0111_g12880 [Alternaria arborescens]RYO09189.1 hypothetical protein AA0111_g12880 [Alternaria arborescens]